MVVARWQHWDHVRPGGRSGPGTLLRFFFWQAHETYACARRLARYNRRRAAAGLNRKDDSRTKIDRCRTANRDSKSVCCAAKSRCLWRHLPSLLFLHGEALAHGHQNNEGSSILSRGSGTGHHTDDESARDVDHSCCGGGIGALTRLWSQWIAQEQHRNFRGALFSLISARALNGVNPTVCAEPRNAFTAAT